VRRKVPVIVIVASWFIACRPSESRPECRSYLAESPDGAPFLNPEPWGLNPWFTPPAAETPAVS
jgi:hypothetical protein